MEKTRARKNSWTFGRGDYLLIKIALVAAMVAALAYVVPLIADWASGQPLRVTSATSSATPVVAGVATQDGATATYAPEIAWSLPHPPAALWVLNLMPRMITTSVIVVGAIWLWRLLGSLQSGLPFGPTALWTVRALGVMVVMWSVVVPMLNFAAMTFTVFEARVDPQVEFTLAPWSLAPFVVGFLLLALGEVFRVGQTLQDDVAGLV